MTNSVDPAFFEGVRFGCANTMSNAEMCSSIDTRTVAHTVVQSVLSDTKFIFLIPDTAGKMKDRAFEKFHSCNTEEALTPVLDT